MDIFDELMKIFKLLYIKSLDYKPNKITLNHKGLKTHFIEFIKQIQRENKYIKFKNKLTSTLRTYTREYYDKTSTDNKNNVKHMWTALKDDYKDDSRQEGCL